MASKCEEFLSSPKIRFLCIRFSSLLTVVGFTLFLYYGTTVVLPAGRAIDFQETKCFVNYSLFHCEAVCDCVAGITQSSCYPCLKIYVAFSAENTEKLTVNVSTLNAKSVEYQWQGT